MDSQTNQNPDQSNQPSGFYSTGPASSRGSGLKRGKLIKWSLFVLLIVGIIGSTLYGVNELLTVANTEREKLAAAKAANDALPADEKVYFGDGSDISEIADAKEIVSCPSGYAEKGSQCQKTETVTASPAVYNCPSDYKKRGSGNNTTCVKVIGGKVESKAATRSVVCEDGYSLSGNSCTKKETTDMNLSYSCSSGYQVSGTGAATKCTKTSTESGAVRASCPSGYWAQNSGVSTICYYTRAPASVTTYSCPNGGSLSGSTCTTTSQSRVSYTYCSKQTTTNGFGNYSYKYVPAILMMGCATPEKSSTSGGCTGGSMGSRKVGTSYVYYCYYRAGAACPSGYTDGTGSFCVKYTTSSYAATGSTTKNCNAYPDLRLNSSQTECYKTGTVNLYCDSGFAKSGSGSGTTCSRVNIQNASANVSKSCPSGYSQSGDNCERTISKAGDAKYTCSDGYDLSGTNCTKIVGGNELKTDPSVSYKCPSGYKTEGSGSDMKCTKTQTSTVDREKQYVCEDGWVRRQAGDKIDCVLVRS